MRCIFAVCLGRLCAAMLAMGAVVDVARADDGPGPAGLCFEIIPAQGEYQPAILLDRCRGRTWQLSRRAHGEGRSQFYWSLLSRGGMPARLPAAASERPRAPAVSGGTPKCFMFNGRQYCE